MTELTILKEVNKTPHPNVIKLVGGCSIGGEKKNFMFIIVGKNTERSGFARNIFSQFSSMFSGVTSPSSAM